MPFAPEAMEVSINGQNETMTLIDGTEVNKLKSPGLTDINFEIWLPNIEHPAALYLDGFKTADYFLKYFEELKTEKSIFQFIVIRELPDGSMLFNTNMTCTIEDFTITEDAKEWGFDVCCELNLKQYVYYGTKTYTTTDDESYSITESRETTNSPSPSTSNESYTVKSGDTLWAIAKYYYGDGKLYSTIYNANTDIITDPNKIYPGQVLTIPAV